MERWSWKKSLTIITVVTIFVSALTGLFMNVFSQSESPKLIQHETRLAVLETNILNTQKDIREIKKKIDKIWDYLINGRKGGL